jgi:DinB superfamily
VESCEICGFAWESVGREEVGPRIEAGTARIASLLAADPERASVRPSPQRWSALEYAGHVRDVLTMLRDRLVVGLVEDDPTFKPMYRDERVDLGLYRDETVDDLAGELGTATRMFNRLFESVDPQHLGRPVQYGFPSPARRTLLWMGQQAVHEVEHHGDDIAENLGLVAD